MKKILLIAFTLFSVCGFSQKLISLADSGNFNQIYDTGNSANISVGDPGSTTILPFEGDTTLTGPRGVQQNIVILTATDALGFLDDLGGTLNFQYFNEDTILTVDQPVVINDFGDLRTVDWLGNVGHFFRVTFTPSRNLIAGETINIQTIHSKFPGNAFLQFLGQDVEKSSRPMPLVNSFLSAFDQFGKSQSIAANEVGALTVNNFGLQIARGNAPGFINQNISGNNPSIGTSNPDNDLWNNGGTYTGFPTSGIAETVTLTSSSVLDIAAGTGARTVEVVGLDASWIRQKDTVIMAGLVGATTSTTWQRVTELNVLTAGATGTNQGTITATHTITTGNVFAVMPANNNSSTMAVGTVPAGETGYITSIYGNAGRSNGSAGSLRLELKFRHPNGVFQTPRTYVMTTEKSLSPPMFFLPLPEMTDFKLTVPANTVSDAGTIVSGDINIIYIKN